MNLSVTLQVPPSIYWLAQKTARATSRPIEQVFVDALAAASPVADNIPSELEVELDVLAQAGDEELWKIARDNFPASKRRAYDRLLDKNSAGTIASPEREQLQALRLESERLMLRKAYAYALLKWRGRVLPALTKIPRPR